MKSIKPGRGPSMMDGIGAVGAAIFGVIWTLLALSMGAPILFALFGVVFIGMAIVQAYYNFHNATSKNRYSSFDITEEGEESDPLQERFGGQTADTTHQEEIPRAAAGGYCPYCGAEAEKDYRFCRKCGKRMPD